MPAPETEKEDDDFVEVNEKDYNKTPTPPPPEDPPLQKTLEEPQSLERHNIFEPPQQPPSRDISMVATVPQPDKIDKIKSLFFSCLFCCRPSGNIKAPKEESNSNKKGLRYENG